MNLTIGYIFKILKFVSNKSINAAGGLANIFMGNPQCGPLLKNAIKENIIYCKFPYLNEMELQIENIFMKWSYPKWHQDISGDI